MSQETSSSALAVRAPDALAFYHADGFVPAYKQATKFAGKTGRVATMPDIVEARLKISPCEKLGYHNPSDPTPWDQYYTSMSAEYVGLTKGGVKVIIVAHGVGPMATLQGVLDAYRYQFDDKTRSHRGGRISQQEFWKLESGWYGQVSVIDFNKYCELYEYPFIETLKLSQALGDPLLLERLGPKAAEYLKQHASYAVQYHKEQHQVDVVDPWIITVENAANCSYQYMKTENGMALAHLLSIGQIGNVHLSGRQYPRYPSWVCDISAHEWWNGVRLIGMRSNDLTSMKKGPDPRDLLHRNWRELMESTKISHDPGGFYTLMQLDDKEETWFTQVDKVGGGAMDTHEPEFHVTKITPVGEPVRFYTPLAHYHGFFKYEKGEARAVMPAEANAYVLYGEPENVHREGHEPEQTCLVQPYRVEIDFSQRLMSEKKLAHNYNRMMELMKIS